MAFHEAYLPMFKEHGSVLFENKNPPSADQNFAYCKVRLLTTYLGHRDLILIGYRQWNLYSMWLVEQSEVHTSGHRDIHQIQTSLIFKFQAFDFLFVGRRIFINRLIGLLADLYGEVMYTFLFVHIVFI